MFNVLYFALLLTLTSADRYHPNIKRPIVDDDIIYPIPNENEDKSYWEAIGVIEMTQALNQAEINTNQAKNVILFLGDGMGFTTITPARIYRGQQNGFSGEESSLSFDDFPHMGLSKSYSTDYQVTDSAASGTAYLTGVKTNKGVIGVDRNVLLGNCSTLSKDHHVFSISKWSQDVGKRIGFVTTTRVTHATPAATYAHTADRNWENDSALPSDWETICPDLKDIARQLVEDVPGNNMNVMMGGGYQCLSADAIASVNDPIDDYTGVRADGRNLLDEWLQAKLDASESAAVVRNRTQLMDVDFNSTDYLFGVYANDHLPYAHVRRENILDIPTLAEMTECAIKVLDKGTEGYFLLVEGGKIDWAHHDGLAKTALDETIDLDDAVRKALEIVDLENTLVIVTADHSHTVNLAGYAPRGNSITGIAAVGNDGVPYTSLIYGNGPGYNITVTDGEGSRPDPTKSDISSFDYVSQSAADVTFAAHGGEDIPIFAIGPWSHLFYKVHEQVFIPNVMAYASCVGHYEEPCLL